MPKRKQYAQSRINNLKRRRKADNESNDSDEKENTNLQVTPTQQPESLQVHGPQSMGISSSTLHGLLGPCIPHQFYFAGSVPSPGPCPATVIQLFSHGDHPSPNASASAEMWNTYQKFYSDSETVDLGPENTMAIMRSSTSSNSDSEQSPLGPAQAYHDSARAQEMALDSELVGSEDVVESVMLGNMHGPGEPWHEYKFIQESGLCCSMAGDSESEVLLDEDFDPDSKSSVESEDESGGDSDLAASTSDSETENETDLALAPVDSADESEEVQVRVQEAEGLNLNTLDHSWEVRKPPIVELACCALRDLKLILKPPWETGRGQKDPQLPLTL